MDSLSSKPKRIGIYDIVDVIGRGGMGTVYRANDPRIGRAVAIKVLTAAADDPDLLTRFYREATYTGNLQHQNIVTVYELGHEEGVPYLVMEYLEGVSLENVITSGRQMPFAEKLGIILQVCSGLTYAHKRGLVHRDIKPANIVILADGTAKIVDFGIALLGGTTLTRTGHIVGSLNYMSPEQLGGDVELDVRTDVYSTGVVLFQMLTGILPFEGGSTAATLRKIMQDPPPLLTRYMKDCPPELEGILQKALAKNRDERYPTAEDMALDISRVHHQSESKMLAELLNQAADAVQHKDFSSARQLVMRVLRAAPQSAEAAELLRRLKQAQEQQLREQNILQLQMKSEEAFRKGQFDEAMQLVDQGIQIDPSATVFVGLRDAIREARTREDRSKDARSKAGSFPEILKRAEEALRLGDLESAKNLVVEAQQSLPHEAAPRALAAQIIARLEQQLRDQKAREQKDGLQQSATPRHEDALNPDDQTIELSTLAPHRPARAEPVPSHEADQSPHDDQEPRLSPRPPIQTPIHPPASPSSQRAAMEAESQRSEVPYDVLVPKSTGAAASQKDEIAPELREFLPPKKSPLAQSTTWLGITAVMLAAVLIWMSVRPEKKSASQVKQPAAVNTTSAHYVEVNAEPWATITSITPATADAPNLIGQVTPLEISLPPGQYTLTLQGPNHQQKQIDITVPAQGGASYFAVFSKPDLNRIVGPN